MNRKQERIREYDSKIAKCEAELKRYEIAIESIYNSREQKMLIKFAKTHDEDCERPKYNRSYVAKNFSVAEKRKVDAHRHVMSDIHLKIRNIRKLRDNLIASEEARIAEIEAVDERRRNQVALGHKLILRSDHGTRDKYVELYMDMARYLVPGEKVSYIDIVGEGDCESNTMVMERRRYVGYNGIDQYLNVPHAEVTMTRDVAEIIVEISKCRNEEYEELLIHNVYDVQPNLLASLNRYIIFGRDADEWRKFQPAYDTALEEIRNIDKKIYVLRRVIEHKRTTDEMKQDILAEINVLNSRKPRIDYTRCIISPTLIDKAKRIIKQK